jgi:hypothetical protein
LSEVFQPVVSHSKLGEAALRLNGLNGGSQWLEVAIAEFEKSLELGNTSPELKGLLADVYLRRGRLRHDLGDLERCVALKQEARIAGRVSRENLSVSARVHFQLGIAKSDPIHFRESVFLLGQALLADPDWPWPAFQLAEITQSPAIASPLEILASLPGDVLPPELIQAFGQRDEKAFLEYAAVLVLRNTEFKRRWLGGRRRAWDFVYTVEDPHRLLSETFVFKHTTRTKATRDMMTIAEFRKFLHDNAAPRQYTLPYPVHVSLAEKAITEDAAIYMMRKARGRQLGYLVIEWRKGRSSDPLPYFTDALRFLAHFRAWGAAKWGVRGAKHRHIRNIFSPSFKEESIKAIGLATGTNPLLFVKKDAHPENWLVTDAGAVLMLDFEASKPCPILLDVAQLLEDYPLLACDAEGWNQRLELISEYLEILAGFGVKWGATAADCNAWYGALTVARCAFSLRRFDSISRQPSGSFSSSALRAVEWRRAHHRELLRFLSNSSSSPVVRATALEILGEM